MDKLAGQQIGDVGDAAGVLAGVERLAAGQLDAGAAQQGAEFGQFLLQVLRRRGRDRIHLKQHGRVFHKIDKKKASLYPIMRYITANRP